MTTQKQYFLNRESGRIELYFTKEEYKALSEAQKSDLKRFFLFSKYRQAWVSRSTQNHYMAIKTAKKLGFVDGGKIGEALSYVEQLEQKVEKAEARAERYEQYAENAEKRAEMLQKEMNEHLQDHDIAFFTQPIIKGHAGSERFARQRQRIYDRYHKGFEEYRKSEYFKEKASIAQETASMKQLKDKTYLHNRIEECNKNIRLLEKYIVTAEERQNEKWLENLLEKMEYEVDKLAFFQNCMDNLGGVQYNKDNVKPGYLIKIRGEWQTVVKANPKTVEVQSNYVSYTLKYPYAEIRDLKIPEGWTEPKNIITNPFRVDDIVCRSNITGTYILTAYQVVKVTEKSVVIQQIKVENNKPVLNEFISDKQTRKQVKKDRSGNFVLNDDGWYLYKYNNEKELVTV